MHKNKSARKYNAIEEFNRGYMVREISGNMSLPTNGVVYETQEQAQKYADENDIKISKVGTLWEII